MIIFGEHVVAGYKKIGYAVKADASGPVLAVYDTREDAEKYGPRLMDNTPRRAPKRQISSDYPAGRVLDCGCTVYNAVEVLTSANGTCCAYCYDQMSA